MKRKPLSKVPIYAREAYNKALSSAVADPGYAMETLRDLVKSIPDFGVARDKLRELECNKAMRQNPLAKAFWVFLSVFTFPFIKLKAVKDPFAAMAMCEGPLAKCVDNPLILTALADAAEDADAAFASAEALSIIHRFHPNNDGNNRRLVEALQRNGQAREALKIFQDLAKKNPKDLGMQGELRSALALASIERGNWEEEGTTQSKSADSQAAVTQQLIDGTIHDADQAKVLIEKFTKDLEENDSMDIRRKLADAYMVAENYEAAINEMKIVAKKLGALDPALDKQIEKAYMMQLDQAIATLKADPDSYENAEAQIEDLEKEKLSYRLRKSEARSKAYPNDPNLHFDLGVCYFENGDYEPSLTEFEHTMRTHQKRVIGATYSAKALIRLNRAEEAIAMLEKEFETMSRLDRFRNDALYALGLAYEAVGRGGDALAKYREIAQKKPKFEDIAARIERLEAETK